MKNYLDPQVIALLVAIVVSFLILAFGLMVIKAMWRRQIDLSHLLSETVEPGMNPETAKASLSRFQFLIFTFVVAGLYFVLSLETGSMIDVPNGTLVLLGISGATYVAGKVIKPGAAVDTATPGNAASQQSNGGNVPNPNPGNSGGVVG